MRKIMLLLAVCVFAASCGFAQKEEAKSVPQADGKNAVEAVSEEVVTHLTKQAFIEKVCDYESSQAWKYRGDLPAIVDFYATWCPPCKAVAPVLEKLAGEYAGKIRIYKVDVDREKELAAAFGVRNIPTFLFIPMDGQPRISVGGMDEAGFKQAIDSVLLK